MAKVMTDDRHYKAIADTIRDQGFPEFVEEKFTPDQMAETVQLVCDFSHVAGLEEGIQTEYDRFWDAYQPDEVASYSQRFSGNGWNAETFRPKRSIRPTNANQMFFYAGKLNFSFPDHFTALGVELDFSKCTAFSETFLYCNVTELGVIDTRSASNINYLFRYANQLVTIQNLILKDDGSQTVASTTFQYANALENLTITGTIGKSGLDFSTCTKLSKASITSVVNALSSTTSGLSVTFSKTAIGNAFTEAEWNALAATKPNWTINWV